MELETMLHLAKERLMMPLLQMRILFLVPQLCVVSSGELLERHPRDLR
jgi:hypothetical protein